ncbi:MAG: hypothetical protein M9928_06275 [Anaerolineae bacterium]|nr:hypothetical protein [Anaerolineae bacterium]MCO5204615.1 hypothetical protein [Anaerolineae bacterium]
MFKKILILVVTLLVVAACTPVAEQPDESADDGVPVETDAESVPALAPVADEGQADSGYPTLQQASSDAITPDSAESSSAAQEAATPETNAVAPAATVVLSEITPSAPDPNATPQEMPAPGRPGEVRVPPTLQPAIDALIQQLGADMEAPSSAVQVTGIEAVTWNDGSLGCPEEGMMYTQALVDGYLITFNVVGNEVEVHTNGLSSYVICDDGPVATGTLPGASAGGADT